LSSTFTSAPGVDTLNNRHAVDHAAGTTIPLRQYQNVTGTKGADRLVELGPVPDALAGDLLLEDVVAPLGHKRP
jgi:hypothetical protein